MKGEPLLAAVAAALAAGTWGVQTGWDRYDVVGDELLEDGGLDRGLAAWQSGGYSGAVRDEGGVAVFTVEAPCGAPTCGAILQQDVATPPADAVVLSIATATDAVGGPPTSVALLNVFLLPRDASGASLWDEAIPVVALGGTHPWATTERGVRLQEGWASLSVVVQLRALEGSARVDALSLRAGRMRADWARAVGGLSAGWIAAATWATAGLARAPATRWRGLFLAACAAGLATLLMPARIVDDAVDTAFAALSGPPAPEEALPDVIVAVPVSEVAAAAEPAAEPPDEPGIVEAEDPLRDALREAAPHFGLFVLIAALGGLAFPEAGRAAVGARLLGFAGITEILQLFTPDRGPALDDVAADAAGVAVGLLLARLARSS